MSALLRDAFNLSFAKAASGHLTFRLVVNSLCLETLHLLNGEPKFRFDRFILDRLSLARHPKVSFSI